MSPIKVRFKVGEDEITDGGTAEPTLTDDATASVAVVSSTGRMYWMVEGQTYYVDGTVIAGPSWDVGMPMGLLLAITYASSGGG